MNDERAERELWLALQRDDPGHAGEELRARVAAIPDAFPVRRRRRFVVPVQRLVAFAAAVAAVGIVGGTILFGIGGRGTPQPGATNPTGTPQSSRSAPVAVASPTPVKPAPSGTPAPAAVAWTGLRFTGPLTWPDASGINAIVRYEGGLFAIGRAWTATHSEAPGVWRSSDGANWTELASTGIPSTAQLRGIVVTSAGLTVWGSSADPVCSPPGAGQTCGIAPAGVWTSTDGATWRDADLSVFAGAAIEAMAAGPAGAVAVGNTGTHQPAIWVAADGRSWQRIAAPASVFVEASLRDVEATPSGFVLAGSVGPVTPSSGGVALPPRTVAAAWWSTDGLTWTRAAIDSGANTATSMDSIYPGADGIVAIGSLSGGKSGAAWTSADGGTWRWIAPGYLGAPAVAPGTPTLPSFNLASDGTHIVAARDSENYGLEYWASVDGSTWRKLAAAGSGTMPAQIGATRPWINQVFPIGGRLVITGTGAGAEVPYWLVTPQP